MKMRHAEAWRDALEQTDVLNYRDDYYVLKSICDGLVAQLEKEEKKNLELVLLIQHLQQTTKRSKYGKQKK